MYFRRVYIIFLVLAAVMAIAGCQANIQGSQAVNSLYTIDGAGDNTSIAEAETADEDLGFVHRPEKEEMEAEADENAPVAPPNEIGDVMIIMYHSIVPDVPKNNMERSEEEFQNDLQLLYDNGYRLISLADLIHNTIDVPAGYSPVVLTFDDGWSSAFSLSYEEETGQLLPRRGCAVDIINRFSNEYPDFGKGCVFYINGYQDPFKGDGSLEERFQYLFENGYELGNHTYSHKKLSKLNEYSIQEEMLLLEQMVQGISPGYQMLSMAYPYGSRPVIGLRDYALQGEGYAYRWALREGPSGASAAPNNVGFDPLNVPRIRGTSCEAMDLGWYLNYYMENPELRYISDGDPDVISVPLAYEEDVNKDSLGGKVLHLY